MGMIDEFAPVDWRAGMLVRAVHMTHASDHQLRVLRRVAVPPQLGSVVLAVDDARPGEPLVTLEGVRGLGTEQVADCRVQRAFVALTVEGRLLSVRHGRWTEDGDGARVTWSTDTVRGRGTALLILELVDSGEAAPVDGNGEVEVHEARIRARVVVQSSLPAQSRPYVCVGRLTGDGTQLEPQFVPNVLNLETVDTFAPDVRRNLVRAFDDLDDAVWTLVGSLGAEAFSEEQSATSVRLVDLIVLRAILERCRGDVFELGSLDVLSAVRRIGVPVAHWFLRYRDHVAGSPLLSEPPFRELGDLANAILKYAQDRRVHDVDRPLALLHEFLETAEREFRVLS
ncbi:MAG TPA: hypothetical protein VKA06_09425 [Spirochaetia bacterium]|nr:hypothetical protein [Spirochaetia bacterium]